jgi:hypothetical protein
MPSKIPARGALPGRYLKQAERSIIRRSPAGAPGDGARWHIGLIRSMLPVRHSIWPPACLTGDPAAGTKILGEHSEREQLDGLSDIEVLRRSARQLCIATILACDEFQASASTLVAENPAEAAQLLKALCGALPAAVAAFGEALKSREHPRPQDNNGTISIDPLLDLRKRFEAGSKK